MDNKNTNSQVLCVVVWKCNGYDIYFIFVPSITMNIQNKVRLIEQKKQIRQHLQAKDDLIKEQHTTIISMAILMFLLLFVFVFRMFGQQILSFVD